MQRLFATARWDADLVRDDLRAYAVAALGEPDGVLIGDDTGFEKGGECSAGVQRQYTGTAGKITNCQIGVFLAYAGSKGRALIDRELYLPRCWTGDAGRLAAAKVPGKTAFQTKPQLLQAMIERALAAGIPSGPPIAILAPGRSGVAASAYCWTRGVAWPVFLISQYLVSASVLTSTGAGGMPA
jgi:SRSO17 transposase